MLSWREWGGDGNEGGIVSLWVFIFHWEELSDMAFASECLEKDNGNRSHYGESARGKSFMPMPHLQNLSSCEK